MEDLYDACLRKSYSKSRSPMTCSSGSSCCSSCDSWELRIFWCHKQRPTQDQDLQDQPRTNKPTLRRSHEIGCIPKHQSKDWWAGVITKLFNMASSVSKVRAHFQSVIKHVFKSQGLKYSEAHIKEFLDITKNLSLGSQRLELWTLSFGNIQCTMYKTDVKRDNCFWVLFVFLVCILPMSLHLSFPSPAPSSPDSLSKLSAPDTVPW